MEADERTRRARAAWGYSGKSQRQLAQDAAIGYDRLRAILSLTDASKITLDELYNIAEAAPGVSRAFMEFGFEVVDPDAQQLGAASDVTSRLEEIERDLRALRTRDETLGQLQEQLGVITEQLRQLRPRQDIPTPATVEDAVDQLQHATAVMQELLGQLGRGVGRRDLRYRAAMDRARRAGGAAQ